ncbi:MAG: nucleotide exchange factor GrpE, partial [Candidatus Competibacteraceae bacterium]|nr:nucleotide exchange factor GrpE [Candidatus Competibacteraceae bacterium]
MPVSGEDTDILVSREEFDTLQRDLDQALAKADEHWKLYLGAHAEMENLRKRTERDVQNAHKFALERFFNELLPVRDSLEMGLAAADETTDIAKLREGVDLTLKQLTTAMEKFGVQEVNPVGARFDPHQHEAMAMAPTDQAEPNTVMQVVQ